MGRNKKYFTEEERKIKRREYVRKYYYKNKEKIDEKAKQNYYKRIKRNGI